jgi:hypothetical protein
MEVRIGELLIRSGALTEPQVQQILEEQQRTGEPFGLLSERLFGVDPRNVEQAWADQYAALTRSVDPDLEAFDPRATELVTRRQAWQFRVLPIRFDERELVMATTCQYLRRALGFATNVIGVPVYLVTADPAALGEALCRHYPLPGLTRESIDDHSMDRLLHLMDG